MDEQRSAASLRFAFTASEVASHLRWMSNVAQLVCTLRLQQAKLSMSFGEFVAKSGLSALCVYELKAPYAKHIGI